MSFSGLLKDKVTIFRVMTSQNATTGVEERRLDQIGAARCRVAPLSVVEQAAQGREAVIGTHRVLFPVGTDVSTLDELVDAAGDARYEVTALRPVSVATKAHHLSAIAKVVS